jgi:Ca2+-binding EF-hand superfamily protein
MRRFALLLMMIALISVNVVWAQSQRPLTRQQIIESADKNKDDRIGRVEFLERMKEAFFFIDNDKDGYVTIIEYQQRLQGADPKRVTAADRNKDGKLSIDEFLKIISGDFDAADKNDDGVIDAEEITVWVGR